jgi:hypothetical protein
MLLLAHEQANAQPFLEGLDYPVVPDTVENGFVTVEMGLDRILHVTQELHLDLEFRLDAATEPSGNNRIWGQNLLAMDPTAVDRSIAYDAPGFNVSATGAPSAAAVDINNTLTGIQGLDPHWSAWRQGGAHNDVLVVNDGDVRLVRDPEVCGPAYCGTGAYPWWNWEERMWYLLNLFRALLTDARVARPPAGRDLASERLASYPIGMLARLDAG